MGNVGSSQIGSTFDNAFRHYPPVQRQSLGQVNQPANPSLQQSQQQITQSTQNAQNNQLHQKQEPQLQQSNNTTNREPLTSEKQKTTPYNNQYLGSYYSLNKNNFKPIVDKSNQVIVDTVTTEPKTNSDKLKAAGIIAGAACIIGGITLFLTKGKTTKKLTSFLTEQSQTINQIIETVKSNPRFANKSTLKLTLLQNISKGLMMARGLVFNTTPLKDVLFDKIVCDYLHLRKPCNAITKGFRNLSFSTVKNTYKKASTNMSEMTNLFTETNKALQSGKIAGAKPVSQEVIDTLNKRTSQISTEFNTNFTEQALNTRNNAVSKICKNLNSRVYDKIYGNFKTFLKDVKSWTTFIPEALIEKDKNKFFNSILSKKQVITNNPQDNFKRISNAIFKLETTIDPTDKASRDVIKNLKTLSQSYIGISGANEAAMRKEISAQINKILKSGKVISKDVNYPPEKAKEIKSLINEIGNVINTDKKGLVEELLTTYKEILPPEEYAKLKSTAQKAVNSLNSATKLEGSEYVDKVRDLTDGSALTDVVLSMALPLVSTSIAVSAADTKEKKQSVALKYGIPIISGAITSTIATVKLVSGGKSLALGLISTLITNQICGRIDEKLKQKSQKNSNPNSNIS